MIVLSNTSAIEFLECITDPELGCNIGTEEQYSAACEMLVALQQEDNTQQLMIMLVADQDPDFGIVIAQPVEQCPMPTISFPIMEQLG
jgi:hypothetical protein